MPAIYWSRDHIFTKFHVVRGGDETCDASSTSGAQEKKGRGEGAAARSAHQKKLSIKTEDFSKLCKLCDMQQTSFT
jgi:hypothetical protein